MTLLSLQRRLRLPAPSTAGPALLFLFAVLFFHKAFLGETFFSIDFHLTFQPLRRLLGEALRDGLPLWNPALSNGAPLLANPQTGAFYPPNWIFAWVPAASGLTMLTIAHVLLGTLGCWRLGRRWAFTPAGCWTAAVTFSFCGLAASATAFANLAWSCAWLPWLLVAWDRTVQAERRAVSGFALVTAALLVLSEPFLLLAGALGILILSTQQVLSVGRGEKGEHAVRVFGRLLAGALMATVVALPALISYLNHARASVRAAGFTTEGAMLWSLHPAHLMEFLLPGAFGDGTVKGFQGLVGFWAQELVPSRGHPLFAGMYVGGLVLGLAALGAARATRFRAALLIWFGLLVALALGHHLPLHGALLHVPGFHALRFPVKWLLPAMLPLALLAGGGASRLRLPAARSPLRQLGVALLPLAVLGALSLLALPAAEGWLLGLAGGPVDGATALAIRSTFLQATRRSALPLILILPILLWAYRSPQRRHPQRIVAVALSIDLLLLTATYAPTVPRRFYEEVPAVVAAIRADATEPGRVFVESIDRTQPALLKPLQDFRRRSRFQRDALMGYTGTAYGLRLAFNVDTEALETLPYMKLRKLQSSAPWRERLMLLGAAGVTHVVLHGSIDAAPARLLARVEGVTDPAASIYANLLAVPRFHMVPRLIPYQGDSGFIRAVQAGPDDLFRSAALIDEDEWTQAVDTGHPAPSGAAAGEALLWTDKGHRLDVETSGGGGYLIISDTWGPGWSASVDGKATPVLRVNYAFRAIPVDAGKHHVRLIYSPW